MKRGYDKAWFCFPCEDRKDAEREEEKLKRDAEAPQEWDIPTYTRRIFELRQVLEQVAKETENSRFLSVGTIAMVRRFLKRGP